MKYGNIEGIKAWQLFDSRKELEEAGYTHLRWQGFGEEKMKVPVQ